MSIGTDVPGCIRVLVVDLTGSATVVVDTLLGEGRFQFMGTVSASDDFRSALDKAAPHVMVITTGPNGSARKSVELVRRAHSHRAEVCTIMLLEAWRDDLIVESFRAGVTGVLCANDSPAVIAKCIQSVHGGQVWANSAQLRMVLQILGQQSIPRDPGESSGRDVLTRREMEVIRAVAEGMTNRNIASHLKLSEHTVKNYLFRVFDKLGVSNRSELLMLSLSLDRSKENVPGN